MTCKTLKETVTFMNSPYYEERFIAEYSQLVIRYKKLKDMLDKWDKGELDFEPTCPRSTYNMQIKAMTDKREPSGSKSGSNIVVEWMSEIRGLARDGYTTPTGTPRMKDEKFQRIIGICDAVIMVLKEQ